MGEIIFVLGGARSGKSKYAVELAKKFKKAAFIATALAGDEEMKKRIKLHRIARPQHWKLIEEEKNIVSVLNKVQNKYEIILIDCLGLWISNLLVDNLKDADIEKKINKLINSLSKSKLNIILVSNEVGSCIVPYNPLARRFQDLVGLANQKIAEKADKVIYMQAGIPIIIKGEKSRCKG